MRLLTFLAALVLPALAAAQCPQHAAFAYGAPSPEVAGLCQTALATYGVAQTTTTTTTYAAPQAAAYSYAAPAPLLASPLTYAAPTPVFAAPTYAASYATLTAPAIPYVPTFGGGFGYGYSGFRSFNSFGYGGHAVGFAAPANTVVINNGFRGQTRAFAGGGNVIVNNNVRGGGFGGGGGLGLAGAFRQGVQTGGLAGGLERFTGLGNGSGQFVGGALTGILATRANLFGLGNGGRGGR